MHGTSWETLGNLLLAAFLGAVGQLLRVVAGLKKANDEASAANQPLGTVFDGSRLLISIGLAIGVGAAAGLLAGFTNAPPWNNAVLLSLLGAGYAGSDFIESFMQKSSQPTPPSGNGQKQAGS